jgi:hypothetical protein
MMKDEEILKLVPDALDLDALKAADEGREPLAHAKPQRRRLPLPPWLLSGAAAAAAVIALMLVYRGSPEVKITDLRAEYLAVRGAEGEWHVTGELSRPAHVCVVVIDDRLERWVMPVGGPNGDIWQTQSPQLGLYVPSRPRPDDARGPARGRFLLLLAAGRPSADANGLLTAIPEPIGATDLSEVEVIARLEQIASNLKRRFGVGVRVLRLP